MSDDVSGLFLVQNSPVPGAESEYNDWYLNTHIPELLTIPGFAAARRFRRSAHEIRPGDLYPYEYLTAYEVTGDAAAAVANLHQRGASLVMPPLLAPERAAHMFEAVTERIRPR